MAYVKLLLNFPLIWFLIFLIIWLVDSHHMTFLIYGNDILIVKYLQNTCYHLIDYKTYQWLSCPSIWVTREMKL